MQKKNGSLSHILLDISEWVSRRWIIPAELRCLFGTGTNHCTFKKIQINSRKVLTCYQNTATSLIQLLRSGSKEKIISKRKGRQAAERSIELLHRIFIYSYSFLAERCWTNSLGTWREHPLLLFGQCKYLYAAHSRIPFLIILAQTWPACRFH